MNAFFQDIRRIVGPEGILTGKDVAARSDSWPPMGGCQAKAFVRPANTVEVAAVLKLCHAQDQAVVIHGGLTGLVGGAKATSAEIVISLERMRKLDPVDVVNRTLTVEAGVTLQAVHEAAEKEHLLFPLDFGARGSCTIGGAIATNAGGNSVIRYGMARAQILGLEAVLADGTIISSMHSVIKNNTGYDLKQLFIGSEGTLGIVTRAVLRLWPLPQSRQTALVATSDFESLGRLLQLMDTALGGTLSAFEVMWNDFYALIASDCERHLSPLSLEHPYYVLLESTGSHEDIDRARFERALAEALGTKLIVDAVIAQSRQQAAELWAIRDDVERLVEALHPLLAYDISLGITDMNQYIQALGENLRKQWPNCRMVTFGHLGDGNIHLALTVGSQAEDVHHAVDEVVYGTLKSYRGIMSAEHGIGLVKRDFLSYSRSAEEIGLMKTLKAALDPKDILNPGKIFPSRREARV